MIYFENKTLLKESGEVPELADEAPYELGKARVEREGADVTIVSYSIGMKHARAAADALEKRGYSAEVIDLISLLPWDREAVLRSVRKTHRLCILHESIKQGGFGGEIAATVAEDAFDALKAPILRIGAPFCPSPFSPTLEPQVRLSDEKITRDLLKLLEYR